MSVTLKAISEAGTSIWLDDLSRERMIIGGSSRHLSDLIDTDYVVGVTTNPAIFSASISKSSLYSADIKKLASQGHTAESIITELTTADVKQACDIFMPVFESSRGIDGRISIEVDPRLARDTEGTLAQARQLWEKVARPNVLIKVPATIEGLPAIQTLTSEGISVNVTIIFSVERYQAVLEAFIQGLEGRVAQGLDISNIHSVASFFVSRVDTEIDPRLKSHPEPSATTLLGKAAIANARLAYRHFEKVIASSRWNSLAHSGGNIQRPLWASTGVKDPAYDPTMYVVDLVAPSTVNTMPEPTLTAVKEFGSFKGNTASENYEGAEKILSHLKDFGVDILEVAAKLESEGIEKFIKPWLELIQAVEVAAAQ
jgi:transaldolase